MYNAIYKSSKIKIEEFDDTMKGGLYCPCCNKEVIAKQGSVNAHHFAHKTLIECDQWYSMSEWHKSWQEQFNDKYREVIMSVGGEKHRADVKVNHLVVEFQNSPINMEDFEERNKFYTANGDMLVWLFNGDDKSIKVLDSIGKMKWKYKMKLQLEQRTDNVRCFIEKDDYIYSLQNYPFYGERMSKDKFMDLLRNLYKTKSFTVVDNIKYNDSVKEYKIVNNEDKFKLQNNSTNSVKSALKQIKSW